MSCHSYPTRTCIVGNDLVRSSWDIGALDRKVEEGVVTRTQLCEHHADRELGLDGKASICELLINIVSTEQPKMLKGCTQKGTQDLFMPFMVGMTQEGKYRAVNVLRRLIPPVNRQCLTHPGRLLERGKPVVLSPTSRHTVRCAHGAAGKGMRRKRMPSCNGGDRAAQSRDAQPERVQTSAWSPITRAPGRC